MAVRRHLSLLVLGAALAMAGCFPDPYEHANPYDPDYTGAPPDLDEDGDPADTDCNDDDPTIYTGADETPYDGVDQDCSGADLTDVDGDGFDAEVAGGTDCNDGAVGINPNAPEVCDGADQDCDDLIDDDATDATTFYEDTDDDTYGGDTTAEACDPPVGYVEDGGDCDDTDDGINPAAREVCDEEDNDCDEDVDEGATQTRYPDEDDDGYGDEGAAFETCGGEGVAVGGDCDDDHAGVHPGQDDLCDDVDTDCDEAVDEDGATTYHLDADEDDFGDPDAPLAACEPQKGYVLDATDCDDTDATSYPGGTETCDGRDNNCDGTEDEGLLTRFYRDADDDGYGDDGDSQSACVAPDGYSALGGDCDDDTAAVNPGATETCNDAVDADCDGDNDPADPDACNDGDGDGYLASPPSGEPADCDDTDPDIHPDAEEIGDGKDQDCDGLIDEGTSRYDDDTDGYSEDDGDCDDADPARSPGAQELCDDVDQDCDGDPARGDEDGIGGDDCTDDDRDGYDEEEGDCNDADGTILPGAEEQLDGLDQDCDGQIDERLHIDTEVDAGLAFELRFSDLDAGSAVYVFTLDLGGDPVLLVRGVGEAEEGLYITDELSLAEGSQLLSTKAGIVGDAGSGVGLSAAVGDTNGDGLADLWVGAPGDGRVCGFLSPFTQWDEINDFDKADVCISARTGVDAGLGETGRLAVADLDANGFDDVILGAPGVSGDDGAAGAVYSFMGRLLWASSLTLEDADVSLLGDGSLVPGDWISAGGDLNNDGVEDLAVTARAVSAEGTDEVWIVPGVADFLGGGDPVEVASSAIARIGLATASPESVSADTDFTGDGVEDVVLVGDTPSGTFLVMITGGDSRLSAGSSGSVTADDVRARQPSTGTGLDPALVGVESNSRRGAELLVADSGGEASGDYTGAGMVFYWVPGEANTSGIDTLASAWWLGPEAGAGMGASLAAGSLFGGELTVLFGAPDTSGGVVYAVLAP